VHPDIELVIDVSIGTDSKHTFDAATWNVRLDMGWGVLFDIWFCIKSTVSDSLETLKSTLTIVLFTVISFEESGTAEANVHSSSSLAAAVVLCAKFDVGAGIAPPRRSTVPDATGGGFTDCWKFIGDPCRGDGEFRAAKGSGV
jgi:hypothetical protein